jgi:hypothetical protein
VQARIEELLKRRDALLEQDGGADAGGGVGGDGASEDYEVRIADAQRKVDGARKKFEKLRTMCISAEQGLCSIRDRTKVALREMAPSDLVPACKIPQGTPPKPGKRLERRERCAPLLFAFAAQDSVAQAPSCMQSVRAGRTLFPVCATLWVCCA